MQSGENTQALHRILDFTRLLSIVLLLLHFYSACYPAIKVWGLTFSFLDTLVGKNAQTDHGVAFEIDQPWRSKLTIA